jgi:SAM-dependent methyltransferase
MKVRSLLSHLGRKAIHFFIDRQVAIDIVGSRLGYGERIAALENAARKNSPPDESLIVVKPEEEVVKRVAETSSVWSVAAVELYERASVSLQIEFGKRPPLDASPEELARLLSSICLDGGISKDLENYLYDSHWRFLHTLGLVDKEQKRVLELGANPYFTTVLLWEYRDLDLQIANYFGTKGVDSGRQVIEYVNEEGTAQKRIVDFAHFNIELDPFPYEDEAFETVLFCEILEHLIEDPVAVLAEINRVTKMGGHLIITTPNVARAENVSRLLSGENIYDPYSGFGPYGRHNREYTLKELNEILSFAGFTVELEYTADGHPWAPNVTQLEVVLPEMQVRSEDLGHYLFVRAIKTGSVQDGRPSFLYRNLTN